MGINRLDAPGNAMLLADISHWPRLVESPYLDFIALGQMPREYQGLAFRPAEFEIPENKNDATPVHRRGS